MTKQTKRMIDLPLSRLIRVGAAADDPQIAKLFRTFLKAEKSKRRKSKGGEARPKK